MANELYVNIVEIRWEALDHLVRIHPSIVWSFEVSPNGARGNRRLFSQGQATGPSRWQIFAQSTKRKLQKREKNRTKRLWKKTSKNISFSKTITRAGNWAKQVSLAGKAPSSFLAQINYWSTRLLSHLHGPVHIYVQVRVDVDIKPIWVSKDKKYPYCRAPPPLSIKETEITCIKWDLKVHDLRPTNKYMFHQ